MREFNFRRRRTPALNTTATADISFMLLVFFLVTTSLDSETGLMKRLAAPENKDAQEIQVKKRDGLDLSIDAQNTLWCDGKASSVQQLSALFEQQLSVNPHLLINIQVHPDADYDTYFQLQHTLSYVYRQVRDKVALRQFGKPLKNCSAEEKRWVMENIPQRIVETVQDAGKGNTP
ncbi:MAG: ExbD/TolR family protein [Prevotella sp.]